MDSASESPRRDGRREVTLACSLRFCYAGGSTCATVMDRRLAKPAGRPHGSCFFGRDGSVVHGRERTFAVER
jgi:hypothetical protein